MVGIFADQHVGDGRLGRDAALDEPGGRRRLDHDLFAGPAGVFWTARHDHPELGRHEIEPLRDVLAHDVELPAAAGAGLVLDIDNLFDAGQVRRQRAAVSTTPPNPVGVLDRIGRFLVGKALGLDLLGLLEPQQQLIDGQAFSPATEAMALHLLDDLPQSLVLGALGR